MSNPFKVGDRVIISPKNRQDGHTAICMRKDYGTPPYTITSISSVWLRFGGDKSGYAYGNFVHNPPYSLDDSLFTD